MIVFYITEMENVCCGLRCGSLSKTECSTVLASTEIVASFLNVCQGGKHSVNNSTPNITQAQNK